MSDYYKSKNAKDAWSSMRSKFKKDKKKEEEVEKEDEGEGFFSGIKKMFSSDTAAGIAEDETEKLFKKKKKGGIFDK